MLHCLISNQAATAVAVLNICKVLKCMLMLSIFYRCYVEMRKAAAVLSDHAEIHSAANCLLTAFWLQQTLKDSAKQSTCTANPHVMACKPLSVRFDQPGCAGPQHLGHSASHIYKHVPSGNISGHRITNATAKWSKCTVA